MASIARIAIPEGLLPLPLDCDRLDNLPAYALYKNSVGAVLAEGPGLVIFDAGCGEDRPIPARRAARYQ